MGLLMAEKVSHHKEVVKRLKVHWERQGAIVREPKSYRPDFTVDFTNSPELRKKYGCRFLWVEVGLKSPPTSDKIIGLRFLLSREWGIVVSYGFGGFDKILVAKQILNITCDKSCNDQILGESTMANFEILFHVINEKLE